MLGREDMITLMQVPLLDLKAQYQSIKQEVDRAMSEVVAGQKFILGPEVEAFEFEMAKYSGARYALGVSSGTDALILCLMCEQIGPGDEVIVPAYSFFATAGVVARMGATPVFADIDPETYNLDANAIKSKITAKTKAIIPVHLFGQTADMVPVLALAQKHNLIVIEDAAQAIGAEYDKRQAGTMGHFGCLSFFPTKNLGAFGDAGMVLTNDAKRYQALKILRVHGAEPKYVHALIGGNFRLDALQAAVLRVKLKHLDIWSAKRMENAREYQKLFLESGLVGNFIGLPVRRFTRHVYNQYIIRVKQRDELTQHLKNFGVGYEIYYPKTLPLQECFSHLKHRKGDFPESEQAARETLALPIYPELSKNQLEYVVQTISDFYKRVK